VNVTKSSLLNTHHLVLLHQYCNSNQYLKDDYQHSTIIFIKINEMLMMNNEGKYFKSRKYST